MKYKIAHLDITIKPEKRCRFEFYEVIVEDTLTGFSRTSHTENDTAIIHKILMFLERFTKDSDALKNINQEQDKK